MSKQENDKRTTLEDLAVDEARQDEVKGGPANTYTGRTTVNQGTLIIG